jgi:hypothetical protein
MQFYHPEILFGLIVLAIPIIVHLFQLRKFKPEPFTNVALLKKLIISSRKSSKLKKWLSLITRILILTFLVLAFAQPFIPNANVVNKNKQVNIFLDNSYSMALKGEKTDLFNQAKEELLESLPEDQTYNLITHNDVFRNLNTEEFKSLLFDLEYCPDPLELDKILQKSEAAFSNSLNSQKEMIVLSDFQYFNISEDSITLAEDIKYNFIRYKPQNPINFSIDTAFIESSANGKLLNFRIKASEKISQSIPVSVYDDEKLLGRLSLNFDNEVEKDYSFNLEVDEVKEGRIEIEDIALSYDNVMYFSVSRPEVINVLAVSETITPYINKIYQNDRFNFKQVRLDQLEFEEFTTADVVILNEIESISNALNIAIDNFNKEGGVLVFIPAKKTNFNSYNKAFDVLGLEPYTSLNENSIKLTGINLDHPVFEGVFTSGIENFDYPSFDSYYPIFSSEKALSFSNGLSFLESRSNTFRFNASISDNSNFMQSPLVVLCFYNIALSAQNKDILYLNMGDNYEVKLSENIAQDQVLSLSRGEFNFIPRQKAEGKSIKLDFVDYPDVAGHYDLLNTRKDTLGKLAFNSSRKESKLKYFDVSTLKNVDLYNSFSNYSQELYESSKIKSLWQWFIVLALMFMIIELLLLRFIK